MRRLLRHDLLAVTAEFILSNGKLSLLSIGVLCTSFTAVVQVLREDFFGRLYHPNNMAFTLKLALAGPQNLCQNDPSTEGEEITISPRIERMLDFLDLDNPPLPEKYARLAYSPSDTQPEMSKLHNPRPIRHFAIKNALAHLEEVYRSCLNWWFGSRSVIST